MNFKQEVEEFVSRAKLQQTGLTRQCESTICLRCKGFVNFYFPTVLHHPEVCETCIKILYSSWEMGMRIRPLLEQTDS